MNAKKCKILRGHANAMAHTQQEVTMETRYRILAKGTKRKVTGALDDKGNPIIGFRNWQVIALDLNCWRGRYQAAKDAWKATPAEKTVEARRQIRSALNTKPPKSFMRGAYA